MTETTKTWRRAVPLPEQDDHKTLRFVCEPGGISIEAAADVAAGDDSKVKLPRFSMVAYTGGAMRIAGWRYPVIMDLAGLTIPSQSRPIRFGHDATAGVGHTDSINVAEGKLIAAGVVSRDTVVAREIVASARNGFPWQASLGASVDQFEFAPEGKEVIVNGRSFRGPVNVVRRATLGEISFVDLGADGNTSASVAAKATMQRHGQESRFMDTKDSEKHVVATATGPDDGFDKSRPNDGQGIEAHTSDVRTSGGQPGVFIDAARQERARREKITAIIAEAVARPGADLDRLERISAEAIDNRWTVQETELAVLRALRPVPPAVASHGAPPTEAVLAAALLMTCGVGDERLAKDRDFGPAVVEAAWKRRGSGLHGLFAAALAAEGVSAPHGGEALYRAVVEHHVRAGFSTVDLGGLLGTVGNKLLLSSFTQVNATYERLAQQADFNNFLTYTNYRLDHTGEFAQVGPDGELKHGKLSESSYTNRLATRGQLLTLTREAIVNDDLNALQQLYGTLGRKARIAVEKALYEQVMEASDSFYTAARGNRLTTNALCVEGLAAGEAAMLGMVDADGDPIYSQPAILLVPPGLKYLGDQLFTSAMVNQEPGNNKAKGTDNPYRGRFRVETSPYLALPAMAGYSATTWYLLADPSNLPAFQVAFLQGRRQPTIETADAVFNTLGIQM
ncbi:MAG: hypothetical protein IT485_10050, partial [Gammaproteobacteria bacterium]|nr:hypothetical protein [Gammaproteobacteria bacterium]